MIVTSGKEDDNLLYWHSASNTRDFPAAITTPIMKSFNFYVRSP